MALTVRPSEEQSTEIKRLMKSTGCGTANKLLLFLVDDYQKQQDRIRDLQADKRKLRNKISYLETLLTNFKSTMSEILNYDGGK